MQFPFDLGILGGGQLGRMTIQAAQRMGLKCLSIDPVEDTPAGHIAPSLVGSLDNPKALAPVFAQCARVTLENEFVPAKKIIEAIQMAKRLPSCLIPGVETLAIIQDKLSQRSTLTKANVAGPKAVAIEGDGERAIAQIGFPMVLKARFGGYDGKGTRIAHDADEMERHKTSWGQGGWMAEEFVDFKRELAVMVYISHQGIGTFPTMETIQVDNVCDVVFPADCDASQIAIQAVEAVHGIGLFGVELFETKEGKFMVNEIAPRPHNSGHYSLDWGGASQFEQHVRVVMGLKPAPLDGMPTAMANLLGQPDSGHYMRGVIGANLADPGAMIHWYGKSETKTGRKMGHINATGPDCLPRVRAARENFYKSWKI